MVWVIGLADYTTNRHYTGPTAPKCSGMISTAQPGSSEANAEADGKHGTCSVGVAWGECSGQEPLSEEAAKNRRLDSSPIWEVVDGCSLCTKGLRAMLSVIAGRATG